MKKVTLILGIWTLSFMVSNTAYAGTLNEYENNLLKAAKAEYEYNGVRYVAAPSYINKLMDYLSSDEVDLTKEQSEEAIQIAYGSIETGVLEGYLIPVETNEEKTTYEPGNPSTNEPEDGTNGVDNSSNDGAGVIADSDNENQGTQTNTTENTDTIDQPKGSDSTTKDMIYSSPEKVIDEIIEKNSASSIIKNTGFNMNTTMIMVAGMGVLMLLGMFVTIKSDYFAHSDE